MEISILGLQKSLQIVECLLNSQSPCGISELQLTNSSCSITPAVLGVGRQKHIPL
jgi:hypothetical protein